MHFLQARNVEMKKHSFSFILVPVIKNQDYRKNLIE